MRVAAYQAPYREYPAVGGAELVIPYLERARADGVELVCCPRGPHRRTGNWPTSPTATHPKPWRGTNVLIARAVENGIPLVAADVAGWQGERVSHGTTVIVDAQGTVLAAARELEQDFVVADVHADGPRGGIDGDLFGRANPAVTEQFVALLH